MSRVSDEERFWSKVQKLVGDSSCWRWGGSVAGNGYGKVWLGERRKEVAAHRFAWELEHGPISEGLCVLHLCDNPLCVRPSHLKLGTKQDNSCDMATRRRGNRGHLGLPYGVKRCHGKFQGQVKIKGQGKHLGTFPTVEDAALAAKRERERVYGGHDEPC